MTPVGVLLEQFRAVSQLPEAERISLTRPGGQFHPSCPKDRNGLMIPAGVVESIVLKFLFQRGAAWGKEIGLQLKIPIAMVHDIMRDYKAQQIVGYRSSSSLHDFQYELTNIGKERAVRYDQACSYYGSLPVCFDEYLASVDSQSLDLQKPRKSHLTSCLSELSINPTIMDQLGMAIQSSRALFLFGAPGNGKTSIAQRLCRAFGESIWIPRTILIHEQIVRIYDPAVHEEVPCADEQNIDQRWIRIKRPTIVVGGELTMDQLEMTLIGDSKVVEAPLHIKSNCGVFVVDDFGRQRISTTELLNRWIHPLETRHDFLNLPNGSKICFPFDQLVIFSTNLDPKSLVDEAFLRRIPYKIEVIDPTVDEFRQLFVKLAASMQISLPPEILDSLIDEYYVKPQRPFRFCQPRDLLSQMKSYCEFHERPLVATTDAIRMAVRNYFT